MQKKCFLISSERANYGNREHHRRSLTAKFWLETFCISFYESNHLEWRWYGRTSDFRCKSAAIKYFSRSILSAATYAANCTLILA